MPMETGHVFTHMELVIYDELTDLNLEAEGKNRNITHAIELMNGFTDMTVEERIRKNMRSDFFRYLAKYQHTWYEEL